MHWRDLPATVAVAIAVWLLWGCVRAGFDPLAGRAPPNPSATRDARIERSEPDVRALADAQAESAQVMDSAAPACLRLIDEKVGPLGGNGQSVGVGGGLVVLGAGGEDRGIVTYSVGESGLIQQGIFPTSSGPGQLNSWGNDVLGLHLLGSHAHLATYQGGLVIVDVSDASAPAFVGAVDLDPESWDVLARSSYLYLANTRGLYSFDISNAASPRGSMQALAGSPHGLSEDGTRLYVASYTHVHVLGLSDPGAPNLLGSLDGGTQYYEVYSPGGDHIWAVDKRPGRVVVASVADLARPRVLASVDTLGDARCVAGLGSRLFVGTDQSIEVFDISDPNRLQHKARVSLGGRVNEIEMVGDLVAASLEGSRVALLDPAGCE